MVNIRLAAIGKRPTLKFPAAAARARAKRDRASPRGLLHGRQKAVRCPVYQREQLGAGNEIVGPGAGAGARHHDGAVRRSDACTVAPSGELIIKVGGA